MDELLPFRVACMKLLGHVVRLDPGPEKTAICSVMQGGEDMLTVLKHIHEHGYSVGSDYDMVRAAIAKAEGRE